MLNINDFLLNLPLPLIDHWGYLIIFVSAMVEALPIFGSFVPGHTIVIISGFFAQMGILRLDALILTASAGAIIGDLLGYFIGRKYGQEFITRYGKYFFFHQDKFEATKKLVDEHAGKTLILGRFSLFTRAFTPLVAGMSQVKFYRFIGYDLLGGIIWAVSSVLIGYIFGLGYSTAAKYFGRIIMAAVVTIILLLLAYRYLDSKKHIFVKNHLTFLALNALAIYVFSKMAEDYFDKESTYWFDLWLAQNITLIWQPWLNQLMVFITNIFSPENLLVVAALAAVYFYVKKNWSKAALILFSSGGGLLLGAILKRLIGRLRPLNGLISESGFSFPSQHALMALIFFSLIMFLFHEKIKNKPLKYLFVAGNIFLIILVGFSRIYLKAHWFSDIMAGLALGLFWLTFLILAFAVVIKLFNDKKHGKQP